MSPSNPKAALRLLPHPTHDGRLHAPSAEIHVAPAAAESMLL